MTIAENDPGFDTLAYTQTLRSGGVPDRQAEAHAEAARTARAGLATKADIAALHANLRADIAALRADLYRALWIQGASLIGVMAALIAAFNLFG